MGGNVAAQPFHLTDTDHQILSMKDEDYDLLTWDRLRAVIASGDLEGLTRLPSQLRLYRDWSASTKKEWGTITKFLLAKRLYWDSIPSSDPEAAPKFNFENPVPFAARSDYRILLNDWPYGVTLDIKHVCVWLKTPLPADTVQGAITDEGRIMVNAFIKDQIEQPLDLIGQDKVQWFKNYTILQSIRAVDHVHILIRGVDENLLDTILEKPWQHSKT